MAVPRRATLGWDAVKAEAFADFDEREFELLCRELLDFEVLERHAPDAVVEGPPPEKAKGADLRFELRSPARKPLGEFKLRFGHALTSDDPGVTVYSCKTSRKGRLSWRDELVRDAREGSPWAVEALQSGGRFVALINVPYVRATGRKGSVAANASKAPGKKGTQAGKETEGSPPHASLESRLAESYAARTGLPAADLVARIRIVDANELRELVRLWTPESLSLMHKGRLGVEALNYLKTLDGWAVYNQKERGSPEFEWDQTRALLRDQILATLKAESDDPYGRTIWLIGPPGVGKTRLVFEALQGDPGCQSRSRVATSFDDGRRAISNDAFHERHRDAILVVDDCPAVRLDDLLKGVVEHNRHGRGGLIVLTPIAPDAQLARAPQGIQRLDLGRLDEQATRRMIARELGDGSSDADVESFARLTGGFPWFAALVAKEVKGGAPPPKSREEAARIAICSKAEAEEMRVDWNAEVLLRARTLLLVMLTEDVDWASPSLDRESLCKAVGLDRWSQAEGAKIKCVERGILRVRGKYKYVTPALLEQVVAEMLLRPKPDGPGPVGPLLEKHAKPYLRPFYQRLTEIGLSRESLQALAQPILDTLRTGPQGLEVLGRQGISGAELLFVSRCLPGPLAQALRQRIEASDEEVLRKRTDVRRDLVFALEFAVRTSAGFEDAEAALLRLALAENEAWGNNATGIWKGLFSVEGHMTYRSSEERLALLRARSEDTRASVRGLALHGIQQAITTVGYSIGGAQVEGPYPVPRGAEAQAARVEAWRLLLNRARDPEPSIAERARTLSIELLRDAVRAGIGATVAETLLSILGSYTEGEMRRLRDELSRTAKHDQRYLEQTGASAAWRDLSRAADPRSFADELRLRAGSWLTEEEEHETEQRDMALAAQGLEPPNSALLAEIPWLSSKEAVRSVPILIAAGRVDREHLLLPSLVRMAEGDSPELLSAYLRGWKESGQEDAVDELLRANRANPALAAALALTIWRVGANDERIDLMVELIRSGRLNERLFSVLPIGSWEREATAESLGRLVSALLDSEEPSAQSSALWLLVRRATTPNEPAQRWLPLLTRAMAALSNSLLEGMTAYQWKRAALLLLDAGEVSRALDFAGRALRPERGYRTPEEPWAIFGKCAERDPGAVWRALAPRLSGDPRDAAALASALSGTSVPARLPVSKVMAWVGRDGDRALRVARMVSMHQGDPLPELARALVARFGPDSPCARVLAADVRATPHMVASLAAFSAAQARRAAEWAADPDPRVRVWASRLKESLMKSSEAYAADEEYETRRWGT